ncbi:MAG: Yip1 family protein [Novosphingobium sp.]
MDNPYAAGGGLVQRAKSIILKPTETWPVVAGEAATPGDLITRYALPLIVIGPIAQLIGGQLFGYNMIFATYRPSLMSGLTTALFSLVMGVVAVIVIALVAEFLADKFGGTADRPAALKLVVYSLTPAWVAGILGLIPMLATLGILAGLYGLYLFYQGCTPLLKVPQDKAVGFTAVTTIAAIVLMWTASLVTASVTGALGMGMGAAALGSAGSSGDSVQVNVPGFGKIDTSKMEAAGKQMEAATNGQVKPIDGAQLQTLFPASLNGFNRTAMEANAMGQMGSEAEATYSLGDKSFRLKIIDSSGLGALAGIGSAMGAAHSREDADGYERSASVDGQMQIEKWNNRDHHGEYTQQIASRFMITAEGEADSIDQLKSAVAAVDQGKLAALAK